MAQHSLLNLIFLQNILKKARQEVIVLFSLYNNNLANRCSSDNSAVFSTSLLSYFVLKN